MLFTVGFELLLVIFQFALLSNIVTRNVVSAAPPIATAISITQITAIRIRGNICLYAAQAIEGLLI